MSKNKEIKKYDPLTDLPDLIDRELHEKEIIDYKNAGDPKNQKSDILPKSSVVVK